MVVVRYDGNEGSCRVDTRVPFPLSLSLSSACFSFSSSSSSSMVTRGVSSAAAAVRHPLPPSPSTRTSGESPNASGTDGTQNRSEKGMYQREAVMVHACANEYRPVDEGNGGNASNEQHEEDDKEVGTSEAVVAEDEREDRSGRGGGEVGEAGDGGVVVGREAAVRGGGGDGTFWFASCTAISDRAWTPDSPSSLTGRGKRGPMHSSLLPCTRDVSWDGSAKPLPAPEEEEEEPPRPPPSPRWRRLPVRSRVGREASTTSLVGA